MAKKILFIEDDLQVGKMYKTALENHGYEVDLFPDSETWQKQTEKKTNYDLLLLDLILPGQSGLNLLAELKKEGSPYKNLPVYILTNADCTDFIAQSIAQGAAGYFLKIQTTPHQLVKTLNDFFAKKNLP